MDKLTHKEDFFKEVPNTADLFPKEETKEKDFDIEYILDQFWSEAPLRAVEDYYKTGKVQSKNYSVRTASEFLDLFFRNYLECLKKIMRDNDVNLTDKNKKMLSLIITANALLLEETFSEISDKKVTKEQIIAFFIGNLTTHYNKIKEEHA